MKRVLILLALLFAVQLVAAQDKSTITVKDSDLVSGVIVVSASQAATADQAKATCELHCTKGYANCMAPKPGTYTMVRLPKNWGMYDCTNVDLFPTAEAKASEKVGEYCLEEK